MRFFSIITIVIVMGALLFSCKPTNKVMAPEDFLKIQNEYLKTDLTPESKKKSAEKFGYTLKQYEEMDEKVKTDPKLQEKLGEIKLNKKKDAEDIKKNLKSE